MTESVGVEAEMLIMKRRPDSLTRHAPIFNHHPPNATSSQNRKKYTHRQNDNHAIRSFVKYGDSEFLLTRIPQQHPADEVTACHPPPPTSIPFELELANSVEANTISTTAPPSPTHHLLHYRANSPVVDFYPPATNNGEKLNNFAANPTPPVYRALLMDEEDSLDVSDRHQHQHEEDALDDRVHRRHSVRNVNGKYDGGFESTAFDEPSIVPPAKQTPLKPNECGSYYTSRSPSMNNQTPHLLSFRQSESNNNSSTINQTSRSRTPHQPNMERRSSSVLLNSSTLYKSRRSSSASAVGGGGRFVMPATPTNSRNVNIRTNNNSARPPTSLHTTTHMPPPPSLSDVFYLDRYAVGRVNQTAHLISNKQTSMSRPSSPFSTNNFTSSSNNNTLDLLYDELVLHNKGNTAETAQQNMVATKVVVIDKKTSSEKRKPSIVTNKNGGAGSAKSSIITASNLHQQKQPRRNSAAHPPTPQHSSKVAPLRLPFLDQKGGIYDVPIEIYIPLKRQPSTSRQPSQQEQEILNSQIYFVEPGATTTRNKHGGLQQTTATVLRSSLKPQSIDRGRGCTTTPTSKRGSAPPSPRGSGSAVDVVAIHPTSSPPPKVQPLHPPPPTSRGNCSIPSPTPLLSPIRIKSENRGHRSGYIPPSSPQRSEDGTAYGDSARNHQQEPPYPNSNGTDHAVPRRPPSLRQAKGRDTNKRDASPSAGTTPHQPHHRSTSIPTFNLSGSRGKSSPSLSHNSVDGPDVTPSWIRTLNDSGSPFPSSPLVQSHGELKDITPSPLGNYKKPATAKTAVSRLVESEVESSCSLSPRPMSKTTMAAPSPNHQPTTSTTNIRATAMPAPTPVSLNAITVKAKTPGEKIAPKSAAIRRMSLIKNLKASDSDSDSSAGSDNNQQNTSGKGSSSVGDTDASPSRARSTHVHNPTERVDVGMTLHRLQSAEELHA